MKNAESPSLRIVTYDPRFLSAYIGLNREWIERHFAIEPMDLFQLENPERNILSHGGEIFVVLENESPVGTCAMIPHGPGCFELAKMAIAPETRGRGYGDLLMKHSVDWARAKGARKILLLSNTILKPAIRLYEKNGFKTTRLGPHPDYKRCNIEMELSLV